MCTLICALMCVQLLVEHLDIVAPDPHDALHELLDDLGEVHDVDFLIGNSHLLCLMWAVRRPTLHGGPVRLCPVMATRCCCCHGLHSSASRVLITTAIVSGQINHGYRIDSSHQNLSQVIALATPSSTCQI